MGESWVLNSEQSKRAFFAHVDSLFNEHKYLTYSAPKVGADRSLGQNALFHVWLDEFACHLAKCHYSQLTDGMREGTKRTVKGLFYQEYDYEFMVHNVVCPLSKRSKKDYTSSAKWKQGEMYLMLDWFQNFAATKGCVLESKGEYAKLKREQNK